jgi:hypothetical protein
VEGIIEEECSREVTKREESAGDESFHTAKSEVEDKNEDNKAKSLHEKRKQKYSTLRNRPRIHHPLSMSYNIASPFKSSSKKVKKLNQLLSRLTKQTESSGRKTKDISPFAQPSSAYQNMPTYITKAFRKKK